MSIRILSTIGRNELSQDNQQFKHITGTLIGEDKVGLDVKNFGAYLVGASDRVVEVGSTDNILVLTGHDIKKGDLIRLKTTSNSILEFEVGVKKILSANSIQLDAVLSATLVAGDTFDILRPITERLTSDGSSIASVIAPPMQFIKDSVVTTVEEDTVTPANNAPLPVKLTGVTGDINITAGDLNVQTSHVGASYDSMRIGDGTNLMAVNASLEAQVRDDDAIVELEAIGLQLPAVLGQNTMANSLAVVIASDQSELNVNNIGGTISLPTGASTEAKQDDAITQLTSIAGEDFATEATLAAQSAKLPASLGEKARAASLSTAWSTEDQAVLTGLSAKLPSAIGSNADADSISVTWSTENSARIPASLGSKVDAASFPVTQSTEDKAALAAMSAKLPSVLGQNVAADSLSVVLSSEQGNIGVNTLDVVSKVLHDAGTTNINTGAYTELIADIGATSGKKVQIFNGQGTPFYLAVGAVASEVDKLIVCPGGFPDGGLEVNLPANARISAKAIGSNITSGTIIINIMG